MLITEILYGLISGIKPIKFVKVQGLYFLLFILEECNALLARYMQCIPQPSLAL